MSATKHEEEGHRHTPLAAAFARIERLARGLLGVEEARIILRTEIPDAARPGFTHDTALHMPDGTPCGTLRLHHATPRPPLSPTQQAIVADLAAIAVDALDLQAEASARQRALDNLALRERLLRLVADAPSLAQALDATMAALRDATGAVLCLCFRIGPDGEHMQLVAGQASTPELTEAYLDHLRHSVVRIDNSLAGLVASSGEQQVIRAIDESVQRRFPAISLSVRQKIQSQIITPVSTGSERFAFSVGYARERDDLEDIAAMLLGLAGSLRPLLRRLHDAEEIDLYQRAMDASHDAVLILEAHPGGPPRILRANAAFARQSGLAAEALRGQPYHPLRLESEDAARIALAIAEGRALRAETQNQRHDGSRFWVEADIAPVTGLAGAISHWVAIERDITERRQTQQAIALNEERLRLLARAAGEVVWDWDIAAGTLTWGEGMPEQFGHALPPASGTLDWWVARIAPEDRARVMAGRQAAARSGGASWSAEYQFQKADGSLALVIDRGFVTDDPHGPPRRMVGSMRDVTEQRHLEEQLRQSQRLDAIGRLTGGVAHDFNNLLAVIIGNAELMQDLPGLPPDLRQGIDVIHAAAERGAELTGRLLSFARLHPLAPRVTDLNRLLSQMQPLLRRLFAAQITLEVVESDIRLPVVIDGPQLENALLNLCINARDAMPDGGTLRVEAAPLRHEAGMSGPPGMEPGNYVTITVSDTGTGMNPEVAARAFEPFFTTKAMGKGSGLGLSMVFGFIGQSNGRIALASTPGQGTRVTLYLPQATQAAEVEDAAAAAAAIPAPRGACILLVEDSPALRETATNQLQRLGYKVTAVEDGEAALAALERPEPVDLLFTDIVMPGRLNGYQLARLAVALRPGLRVLFTSGDHDLAQTGHEGAVPLLQKPYRFADLAEQVRQVLNPAC
ncbi:MULTISPECIES: PAS domain S-box protein [Roseomonadaceae]|uniref:histidine kinase n=1 Tax=Falsiroseomonas oleicola TaxID=2801474 RepID=A0ABS6HIS2_9PROT|nr:PAS domain S-box protein [Roseomonas oleicola]MBU8547150.1 PAS domain S-box protein [Roseomonas oleicola]